VVVVRDVGLVPAHNGTSLGVSPGAGRQEHAQVALVVQEAADEVVLDGRVVQPTGLERSAQESRDAPLA